MVNISVNDKITQLPQTLALSEFLNGWQQTDTGDSQQAFAVAVNGEFVPRSQYASTTLQDGDAIDIVSPVGGG